MLCRIIKWAMGPDLGIFKRGILESVENSVDTRQALFSQKLSIQIAALQAVEASFHDTGKIIVIARVGGKDVVKIIDIQPHFQMQDYIRITKELESRFGARVTFADMPSDLPIPPQWHEVRRGRSIARSKGAHPNLDRRTVV